ncbi:restriction endonuclease [Psychrobacter sp. PP-21]|uniref:restriction endonuclease n=1 Tax=Psychrobacter sp. PP-21 TaxID=2957503 RepID=UPI0029B295CC|nr:restriction endonuclease [Psychrobacter sp. PP-21]MDX2373867.1 restriction endonuclease [Psychrobacter sp. PP-21]
MTPKEFEQIVGRIISIMVKSGDEVVWNDKISDPDNPKQMRQIDIAINHDGLKSHIECRHHSAPQDVKWIEELIGRKLSLDAFAMIAVSSSGFTEGATKKAEKHGIFLHTLTEHSPEIAHTWGRSSKVEVGYYGFHPLDIHLVFNELPNANLQEIVNAFRVKNNFINTIFNKLKYAINENGEIKSFPYDLQVEGYAGFMDLLDRNIEKVKIKATTHYMKEIVELPSLMIFSQSSHNYQNLARVERSDAHNSEIISAGSRVKIQIDITKILNIESNKVFSGRIDLGLRQKTQIPEIECIGSADHEISLYDVGFSVSDLSDNVL